MKTKGLDIKNVTKTNIKDIERLAGHGHTIKEIADIMGVSRAAFYKYMEKSQDILDAVRRGRVKTREYVVSKLMEKIEAGDTGMIRFYLERQARQGWGQEVNVNLIPKPTVIKKRDGSQEVLTVEGSHDESDNKS